jgi:hypothetical protein
MLHLTGFEANSMEENASCCTLHTSLLSSPEQSLAISHTRDVSSQTVVEAIQHVQFL